MIEIVAILKNKKQKVLAFFENLCYKFSHMIS